MSVGCDYDALMESIEQIFDPWGLVPSGVTVHRAHLGGRPALTDGTCIWLDASLTEIEVRCALAHELEHIARGHTGHQPPAIEWKVRAAVASQLIPHLTQAEAMQPIPWIADEHMVTLGVALDRLRVLAEEVRACP